MALHQLFDPTPVPDLMLIPNPILAKVLQIF